eukprot:RCo007160
MALVCASLHCRRSCPIVSKAWAMAPSEIWNTNSSPPSCLWATARFIIDVTKSRKIPSFVVGRGGSIPRRKSSTENGRPPPAPAPCTASREAALCNLAMCCAITWVAEERPLTVCFMRCLLISCRRTSTCFLRSSTSERLLRFRLGAPPPKTPEPISEASAKSSPSASRSHSSRALALICLFSISSSSFSESPPVVTVKLSQYARRLSLAIVVRKTWLRVSITASMEDEPAGAPAGATAGDRGEEEDIEREELEEPLVSPTAGGGASPEDTTGAPPRPSSAKRTSSRKPSTFSSSWANTTARSASGSPSRKFPKHSSGGAYSRPAPGTAVIPGKNPGSAMSRVSERNAVGSGITLPERGPTPVEGTKAASRA